MTKDPNNYITIDFTYEDEYEGVTRLQKTVEPDYIGESELGVLIQLYKDFLLACGFTYLADRRIEFVEDY